MKKTERANLLNQWGSAAASQTYNIRGINSGKILNKKCANLKRKFNMLNCGLKRKESATYFFHILKLYFPLSFLFKLNINLNTLLTIEFYCECSKQNGICTTRQSHLLFSTYVSSRYDHQFPQ